MNIRKKFILLLVFSLILLSATAYALNYSNNESFSGQDNLSLNSSEKINWSNINLNTIIYAGAINKTSGEKIIVQKRLGNILKDTDKFNFSELVDSNNMNDISYYFKKIQIPEEGINLTYDGRIQEKLNSGNETVYVSVKVKDNSEIILEGTKEEKEFLSNKREKWFGSQINSVLSSFSENEFNLTVKGSNFFEGNISLSGFEKLLRDSRVDLIKDYSDVELAKAQLDTSVSLINVRNAVWNLGYTGDGIKVCVIDSGIDTSNTDLSSNIVDEKCYCSNDCCPDSTSEDDSAEDDFGHGTHVAGIIASQDSTYKGVSPDVGLYVVKVLDDTGYLISYNDIDNAIDWCKNQGVDIITMSLGTQAVYTSSTCPSWSDTSIDSAYNNGIFIDAASGNAYSSSGISYPACSDNIVSVGAVTDSDSLAAYGNRKTGLLDLLAPGGTTTGSGSCTNRICSTQMGGSFTGMTGTSQAAPHVAGAAALLLEADPSLTPAEIKSALVNNGEYVDGYPRINVLSAINSIIGQGEQGQMSSCTESGYEVCVDYEVGDCTASIAINDYAENNVFWGAVYDSSDPYVLDDYIFGWKGVDAEQVYYDVDDPNGGDCYYGGCDGTEVDFEDTMVSATAPDTANRQNILSYVDTASYACWVWFNDFEPSFDEGANPIYVLDCFSNNDCSASQYCDKSGAWSSWSCVNKKSDGQSCTLNTQCTSGYCDNDGVGSTDDGWCFTPYNTYLDGQESTKCEISTGYGDVECDEQTVNSGSCDSTCSYSDSPPDTSGAFFSVKNSTGEIVAWFDGYGNLSLKGTCSVSGTCNAPSNSFIVQNSNSETVAYISPAGNLCLESGSCSDLQGTCNPSTDAFIIKNSGVNKAYINFTGGLCLTGNLNENVFG